MLYLLVFSLCIQSLAFCEDITDGNVHVLTEYDGWPEPSLKEQVLMTHNYLRSLHQGSPPLVWNAGLAIQAQEWARDMAENGHLLHASKEERNGAGENLFKRSARLGDVTSMIQPVFPWYKEYKCYDFDTGKILEPLPDYCIDKKGRTWRTSHATQVLWGDTSEIGCGVATLAKDDYRVQLSYVCCRYLPKRNKGRKMIKEVGEFTGIAEAPQTAAEFAERLGYDQN